MQRNKLSYWWQFLILCRCYSGHRNLMVVPGGRFMGKTVSSFYNSALIMEIMWMWGGISRISPDHLRIDQYQKRNLAGNCGGIYSVCGEMNILVIYWSSVDIKAPVCLCWFDQSSPTWPGPTDRLTDWWLRLSNVLLVFCLIRPDWPECQAETISPHSPHSRNIWQNQLW